MMYFDFDGVQGVKWFNIKEEEKDDKEGDSGDRDSALAFVPFMGGGAVNFPAVQVRVRCDLQHAGHCILGILSAITQSLARLLPPAAPHKGSFCNQSTAGGVQPTAAKD